ncbi:MAG: ABC transporter ATP-binding protein [Planctomycetota bacterium]
MTTTHTESALTIDRLTKSFDGNVALDAVSFTVPRGSIFGLLGPNGAGKTTMFSLIAGFLSADAGDVRVLDTDVAHISQLRGRMTILPQDASFQRNVPILEQLMFFRLLDGQDRATAEREVDEALEKVGIAEYRNRGIHALSHGMLKRMGIAQAFLGSPEVILLDEPTSGLDPQNAKQIRDLIRGLQQEKQVTTVISSHNLAEIQELCDHVAILDKGRLIVAGSVEEVTRSGRMIEIETRAPLSAAQHAALVAVAGVSRIVDRGPKRYRFELALAADQSFDAVSVSILRTALDIGVVPVSLAEGDSLEETFLRLTGGASA